MSIWRIIVEVNNPEPDRVLSRNGAHRDTATGDDVFLRNQFWNDKAIMLIHIVALGAMLAGTMSA
ncbi:MAG: DUF6552 family protein [Pseudomonadota bacterium]